ncbi:hypothetical protein [Alloscardovia omnicolens]
MEYAQLIICDENRQPVRAVNDYNLDYATGNDENDFALTLHDDYMLENGQWFYLVGTGYAGIIDGVKQQTVNGFPTRIYNGRTLSGVLASKLIVPLEEDDFVQVKDTPASILSSLLSRVGLSSIFTVGECADVIVDYTFDRFTDLWEGLIGLCKTNGLKPVFTCVGGKLTIGLVEPTVIDSRVNTAQLDVTVEKKKNPNHLVMGSVENLESPTILHYYIDNTGEITTTQYYRGIDEVVYFFEQDTKNATVAETTAQKSAQIQKLDSKLSLAESKLADAQRNVQARQNLLNTRISERDNAQHAYENANTLVAQNPGKTQLARILREQARKTKTAWNKAQRAVTSAQRALAAAQKAEANRKKSIEDTTNRRKEVQETALDKAEAQMSKLEAAAIKKLQDLQTGIKVTVSLNNQSRLTLDFLDQVIAYDVYSGDALAVNVAKQIIKVTDGVLSLSVTME